MRGFPLSAIRIVFMVLVPAMSTSQVHSFQYYSMNDGLVANGVNALCQDSMGRLWIGTAEGLSVYDGHTFKTYRVKDGLASNFVTCITEGRPAGRMLIGTMAGGVCEFADGRFTPVPIGTAGRTEPVTALVVDAGGTLWCGTEGGLYNVQAQRTSKQLAAGHELAMTADSDGTIWCATGQVIHRFGTKHGQPDSLRPALRSQEYITVVARGRKGGVWLGTTRGLVLHYIDTVLIGRWQAGNSRVGSIVADAQGIVWIATERGLFMVRTSEAGQPQGQITEEEGLLDIRMNCALVDRENNLWLGTTGHGLAKLSDRTILRFPHEPLAGGVFYQTRATRDVHGHFWTIEVDRITEIWEDPGGLWHQHGHRFQRAGQPLQPTTVSCDARSRLIVGFQNGDIRLYAVVRSTLRPSGLTMIRDLRSGIEIPAGGHLAFLVDGEENLWLNRTNAGVFRYDLSSGAHFRSRLGTTDGLPDPNIRAMYSDRHGILWFGGNDGGVAAVERGATDRLRKMTVADGLPDGHVRAILEDSRGSYWFGTRDGGIGVYRDGKFSTISDKDGLISNTVWSLAEDSVGRIWAGTALGLQSIDRESLRVTSGGFEQFRESIFDCGIEPNGRLWLSTGEAFIAYEYRTPSAVRVPPFTSITAFQVNGNTIDPSGQMNFAHDQNNLTIEFVGISLRDEKATRYQYRLSDAEPEWHPPSDHHVVNFAALEPGTYRFEARAITGDGLASITPAAVTFTIRPPLWQTLWFRILAFGAGGLALFGAYRYRVGQLLEVERTKMRIARDLHDELSSTISSIAYFAQAIRTQEGERIAPASGTFLSRISESAAEVQEAVGDVIWSLNSDNDSWPEILSKFRRFASEAFETRGIHYRIEIPESVPWKTLEYQQRRNFWLIYKEMIANAARHSGAMRAEVLLEVPDQRTVRLIVRDNGRGFNAARPTDRHGVRNIRVRAGLLQGEIRLDTSPGAGTTWELQFKV